MGKYFGTDGFRGEAGIIMRCVSAMVTPILLALSLVRIPAEAPICLNIVWWLA